MKIKTYLDKLYDDLMDDDLELESLSAILDFVRDHKQYRALMLFLKNSEKGTDDVVALAENIIEGSYYEGQTFYEPDEYSALGADLMLCALFTVLMDSGRKVDAQNLSREAVKDESLFWTNALTKTFLLSETVLEALNQIEKAAQTLLDNAPDDELRFPS
jgi:hypothetical protein